MNKSEFIDQVAQKTGQSKEAASRLVAAVLDTLTDTVAAGENVVLPGFGTFGRAARGERQGRNPKTGEAMTIAASVSPKFTPGATFKTKVRDAA